MRWLAKNWWKILIIIGVILVVASIITGLFFAIDLIKDNKQYKQNIENLDYEISRKERVIEVDQEVIKGLEEEVERKEIVIAKKDKKREEGEKENARIALDRDRWKAKVKDLPASDVVIETRIILKTDEIWERPEGVLLSLTAAKNCLAILGDFSLVEKDRDKWRDNYNIAKSEIADLKEVVVDIRKIIITKDSQLFKKDGNIKDWTEKFNKSEKRFKASWWKGIKAGATTSGIIGFILGLVLGK